jgi:hypothetical protein
MDICEQESVLSVEVTDTHFTAATQSGDVVKGPVKDAKAAKLLQRALPAIR